MRELRRTPGSKHGELLRALGLTRREAGGLTKHLAELEEAGLLRRDGARYHVVDPEPLGRALAALAEHNVSATRLLAERAQAQIADAEQLADQLREELDAD